MRHYVQAMASSGLEGLHANGRTFLLFDFVALQKGLVFDVVEEVLDG